MRARRRGRDFCFVFIFAAGSSPHCLRHTLTDVELRLSLWTAQKGVPTGSRPANQLSETGSTSETRVNCQDQIVLTQLLPLDKGQTPATAKRWQGVQGGGSGTKILNEQRNLLFSSFLFQDHVMDFTESAQHSQAEVLETSNTSKMSLFRWDYCWYN